MKAWQIVAWTIPGEMYCNDHMPLGGDEAHPVFCSDEDWQDQTCPTCLKEAIEAGEKAYTIGESV